MFDWIFKKQNVRRFDDSFALTRDSLGAGIRDAIINRQKPEFAILLVAHFPETFSSLQTKLEGWGFDHEIVMNPVDLKWFGRISVDRISPVYLTIADLLQIDECPSPSWNEDLTVVMMVCERHPNFAKDEHIEQFAKQLPLPVELGYFVSLDDAVLRSIVSEQLISLMKQLGLTEQALITSNLISKNLTKSLRRSAKNIRSEVAADSAAEWIERNMSEG